jgi:hypothetical protein
MRLLILAICALPFVTAEYAAAQIHGIPPSVTSIPLHFPPFLPNIPPSVTSLGPNGFGHTLPVNRPFHGRSGFGNRNAFGFSTGAWIAPYFIPAFDASYGYDPGSGAPYMYSGPPAEQTLHIVVDLPAARRDVAEDDASAPPPAAPRSNRDSDGADAAPVDPTVLVFRDGHQQEVSNYAIMGQTVYVFDNRTQKIALGDLDVAATIKVNDDRGVDFHVPAQPKS